MTFKKDAVADAVESILHHEEVDVNDRTEDDTTGRKPTKKKDDVGPAGNFKSTKVKFHPGPKNESLDEPLEKVLADTFPHSGIIKTVMGTELPDPNRVRENKKMKESVTLKGFKNRYEEHSIFEQMMQEVLSKDASAGDWIHDFVHSDNPKFAGKSKAERKKQALAAYYAKQRNEEVESVEELDEDEYDDMLDALVKADGKRLHAKNAKDIQRHKDINSGKALKQHIKKNPDVLKTYSNAVKRDKKIYGEDVESVEEALKGNQHKIDKNKNNKIDAEDFKILRKEDTVEEGIGDTLKKAAKAVGKALGGPDDEGHKKDLQRKMGIPQTGKVGMAKQNEEAEQIDELKKSTVKSYIAKKTDQMHNKAGERMPSMNRIKKDMSSMQSAHDRNTGVKPTSEEVEQIDEEMKTKMAYVPYVHTDRHGNGFGGFDVHYAKEADAKAHVDRHGHTEVNGKKGWVEKHEITKHPVHGNWVDANSMRRNSVHEETVEEGWDDMVKDAKERVKAGPKPSGGAGMKQGSRYGGSKQKDDPKEKEEVKESKHPEDDSVPFAPPYNTTSRPAETKDKSGATHTPMSRAKHLAKLAMGRVKKDLGKKA